MVAIRDPTLERNNDVKNKIAAAALAVGLIGGGGAGVILGMTQLSSAQTNPAPAVTPAADATAPAAADPADPATGSNEEATHEAGESAQREADEAAGKGGFGHHHGGGSHEDAAHEAGESTAREAEEDAAKAAGDTPATAPSADTSNA